MRAFAAAVGRDHPRALRRRRTPKLRRFRYGVQVNSLGPDRGAAGEQRPAHRAGDARRHAVARRRARAVQLPAWNEALGLPRPWDQQWSLRMQQVLAFETDLLEYDDLFEGSHVVEAQGRGARRRRPGRARAGARAGRRGRGRRVGYMKGALVRSLAERRAADRVGRGRRWSASTGSPRPSRRRCTADGAGRSSSRRPGGRGGGRSRRSGQWRAGRDAAAVDGGAGARCATRPTTDGEPDAGHARLRAGRRDDRGVGRRAARGVRRVPRADRASAARRRRRRRRDGRGPGAGAATAARARPAGCACSSASRGSTGTPTAPSRSRCAPATPASRWSTRASGSRRRRSSRPPCEEDVDVVGLSVLSGSHLALVPGGARRAARGGRRRRAGRGRRHHPRRTTPRALRAAGVARGLHAEGLPVDADHGRDRHRHPRRAGLGRDRPDQRASRRSRTLHSFPMSAYVGRFPQGDFRRAAQRRQEAVVTAQAPPTLVVRG